MTTGTSPFCVPFTYPRGFNVGFAVQRERDMMWYDFSAKQFVATIPAQPALYSLAVPVGPGVPDAYLAMIPDANPAIFLDSNYFIYFSLTREGNNTLGVVIVQVRNGTDNP